MQGEKLSANVAAPDPFRNELLDFIERQALTLEQIYNCDEMELFYRMLPPKTLASELEKNVPGMKKNVMLMACSDASGSHKLPFFVHR